MLEITKFLLKMIPKLCAEMSTRIHVQSHKICKNLQLRLFNFLIATYLTNEEWQLGDFPGENEDNTIMLHTKNKKS